MRLSRRPPRLRHAVAAGLAALLAGAVALPRVSHAQRPPEAVVADVLDRLGPAGDLGLLDDLRSRDGRAVAWGREGRLDDRGGPPWGWGWGRGRGDRDDDWRRRDREWERRDYDRWRRDCRRDRDWRRRGGCSVEQYRRERGGWGAWGRDRRGRECVTVRTPRGREVVCDGDRRW
jgi:hypothetical protein